MAKTFWDFYNASDLNSSNLTTNQKAFIAASRYTEYLYMERKDSIERVNDAYRSYLLKVKLSNDIVKDEA
jgi:hypothetical protein